MPKINGCKILSELTKKAQSRLSLVTAVAIVSKAYRLPVGDLKMLGMEFPAAIFDVSILLLVGWYGYNYLVRWIGDLMAFRLWSHWDKFGQSTHCNRTAAAVPGFLSGVRLVAVYAQIGGAGSAI